MLHNIFTAVQVICFIFYCIILPCYTSLY